MKKWLVRTLGLALKIIVPTLIETLIVAAFSL
jgi:hypothetical protein